MANFSSTFRALSHGSLNWDTQLNADLLDLEGRLKDSGWVTTATGITASPNFTLNSSRYRSLNGVVSVYVNATRTGTATGAATAAGILTGSGIQVVGGLPFPAQANGLISAVGPNSTIAAAGYVTTGGILTVTNAAPSQTIPVGAVLELIGTYFL